MQGSSSSSLVLLVPLPPGAQWTAHLLVGWIVGTLAFCLPLLRLVFRLDAAATADMLGNAEGGRTETDVIVVIAALASLGAVGLMLLGKGSGGAAAGRVFEGLLSVLAVAAAWLAVTRSTSCATPGTTCQRARLHRLQLRRAADAVRLRVPVVHPRDDIPGLRHRPEDPCGATPRLRHTLLSYVFGTVIVAATINLVVGLAGSN